MNAKQSLFLQNIVLTHLENLSIYAFLSGSASSHGHRSELGPDPGPVGWNVELPVESRWRTGACVETGLESL